MAIYDGQRGVNPGQNSIYIVPGCRPAMVHWSGDMEPGRDAEGSDCESPD